MGHVCASNFSSGTSFASGASPSRWLGEHSPSVRTYAGACGIAKRRLHGSRSISSTGSYAGVMELVASSSTSLAPADMPVAPILSGLNPRFVACERTTRTARWASSQADWWIGMPFGRGVR